MKKVKRILAVIMSAVVLLCSMSIGSFAASGIQSVDISMNVGSGVDVENWQSYLTVNTSGVKVIDSEDSYRFFVFDGDYSQTQGEFETGGEYFFEFALEVEDGYCLPDSEFEFDGVTINGESAEYYLWYEDLPNGNDVIFVYYYLALVGPVSVIDLSIDVYNGMTKANYYEYIDLNSNGLYFYYGNFHPVNIIDSEGNSVDVFESGEEYTVEIFFEPKDGCYFAKDDTGAFVMDSVTVNGEDADFYIDSYTTNGYYEYIKVVAKVTAKTRNCIEKVALGIDENLVNVDVADWEDYVTIYTDGLVFEDYLGDPAAWAVDSQGNYVDTFEKGDIYTLYICFRADEGYFISQANETFDSLKINGEEYGNYYFSDYIAEDGKYIYYVCVEQTVDLVGDGFFDRLIYSIKTMLNNIRMFFEELFFIGFMSDDIQPMESIEKVATKSNEYF